MINVISAISWKYVMGVDFGDTTGGGGGGGEEQGR